ncbi:hypothetical protein [Roseateles sp. P5_E7]
MAGADTLPASLWSRSAEAVKIATEDFYMLAYRSALTDLFPLTKLYCQETGQLDMLKAQPWFSFWRILRNCFAHDLVFNSIHTKSRYSPSLGRE